MRHLFTFLFTIIVLPLSIKAQDIIYDDLTDNKGKVEWEWRKSLGNVPFGKPVTAELGIKNISNEVLFLKDVQAGCHCTIVEFSKKGIQPGETSYIKATYDASSEGQFYKIVTLTTNFDPIHYVSLAIEGTVKPRHN
jgi:hypothetical protein